MMMIEAREFFTFDSWLDLSWDIKAVAPLGGLGATFDGPSLPRHLSSRQI